MNYLFTLSKFGLCLNFSVLPSFILIAGLNLERMHYSTTAPVYGLPLMYLIIISILALSFVYPTYVDNYLKKWSKITIFMSALLLFSFVMLLISEQFDNMVFTAPFLTWVIFPSLIFPSLFLDDFFFITNFLFYRDYVKNMVIIHLIFHFVSVLSAVYYLLSFPNKRKMYKTNMV